MAKKPLLKSFLLLGIFLFIAGCAPLFNEPETYEEHLYPYILEQINETARFFYYNLPNAGNARRGPNEVPGVCNDYASHFVDNYRGPGQIYRVITRADGKNTVLERRVKVFAKSDIKFSIADRVESFYSNIMTVNSTKTPPANWTASTSYFINPESQSFEFHTNRNGTIFILDNKPIPTPLSHSGRTGTQFYNHAWVRIIWNGITVDIDPTWYDNGLSLNETIRIIN